MTNKTSIYERLRKSQNRQTRLNFAHDWADDWEGRYVDLLGKLKRGIDAGDKNAIAAVFADLHALNKPKFKALHNVIDELDTPTRELVD